LELALDSVEVLGACDAGYSCAYANTMRGGRRHAVAMETIRGGVRADVLAERHQRTGDAAGRAGAEPEHLRFSWPTSAGPGTGVGAGDRGKLTEYLEAVRDVERRIQTAEGRRRGELRWWSSRWEFPTPSTRMRG